jgi:predicted Zn-dependent peptidase
MILNVDSQTELSGFYVIYNGTVINEKSGIYGISHLIEHLMSHNINDELVEKFQDSGVAWNAYTSPTNIVFYLSGLDKHVSKYKYEFLDRLKYLNLTPNEFELEKTILLEEYTSIFNMQSTSHLLNLYRKLFDSYNPLGRKKDIERLTLDVCQTHFSTYFSKPSKIINVSKNSLFKSDIEFNNFNNHHHIKYDFNSNAEYDRHTSILNKSSVIYLSPIIESDWPVIFFINYLLSNGINSPLYKNIRKKSGLAYYIRCNLDRMSDYSGLNIISTETDDDKVERLMEAIDETLSDLSFLTRAKFEQVKNSIINKIDTVDINRHSNVETYIKPDTWAIESNIHNISYNNVVETYMKYYKVENFYKSVDKLEFNKRDFLK